MTLKNKISFIVSLLFSVIFAISATVIYLLFDDFRKEEFERRLKEKALSSIKLLVEVEQVDRQLLKVIDQNSINQLYNEKTLIFDVNYKLIYSSLDDTKINWTVDDLKYLKTHKTFFKKDKDQEVYGVFYDTNDKDFYALISASDNFGKRKLEYLLYILLITYVVFTVTTWLTTYYVVKKLLFPIDAFYKKLKGINENNLDTRITFKDKKDEIDLLAFEFNHLLQRLGESYKKQKEFTAHASHELRTPLSRIIVQLENKIIQERNKGFVSEFNENILRDINQLSELISSLLLLSKLDNESKTSIEVCRMDDIIFEAAEKVNAHFPDFVLDLNFLEIDSLEVETNKSLTIIAFTNLFQNACLYSDNQQAQITLQSTLNELIITITNNGKTLSEIEQKNLFEPFMRGKNVKSARGLGLGLRIVQRILNRQKASIHYSINDKNQNTFTIRWPLTSSS